jgi:hypothetical protein
VAAPAEQTLEALVRDELRGPVTDLVRQVVVELVREQLNGAATMPASGAKSTQDATGAPDTTRRTPVAPRKCCNGCERDLPADAFTRGHSRCRECRPR